MSRKARAPEAWRNAIVRYADEAPESLLANPQNWRIHPREQTAALVGSLNEVGWIAPVIVNETTQHVVDGHARIGEAIARGEPTVPVAYVNLTEDQERLALATFDPIAAMAGTDQAMLDELLSGMTSPEGLADLLASLASDQPKLLNDDDADLTPPVEPITKAGDLWLMGEHRLLCGDAFIEADHERVLDEQAVDLVLTDPPYGVGIKYGVVDDNHELIRRVITECMPLLVRWPVVLITTGHRWLWEYPTPTWICAWVHPAGMGLGPWGFTCLNPILAYGADPYLKRGMGSRADTLVLAADRAGIDEHPVAKPLDVWEWCMTRGSALEDQVVFDPFAGAGTTIIAAEKLNRRCAAIEIDPAYCDVIVRRWETLTGKKAERG